MEKHEERRKNAGLSDEQIEAIKDAILDSIYQEIGRSIVKKVLWVAGSAAVTLSAWLGFNHISIK